MTLEDVLRAYRELPQAINALPVGIPEARTLIALYTASRGSSRAFVLSRSVRQLTGYDEANLCRRLVRLTELDLAVRVGVGKYRITADGIALSKEIEDFFSAL